MATARLVPLAGGGEEPTLRRRTDRPCWRCRPESDPTLVRFDGSWEDFQRTRRWAEEAGTCVDVAIALALELRTALEGEIGASTRRVSVLEAHLASSPPRLAPRASQRSWQRYLIAGTTERPLDQLPRVAVPRALAESLDRRPHLNELFSVPVEEVVLGRRLEVLAVAEDLTLEELVSRVDCP